MASMHIHEAPKHGCWSMSNCGSHRQLEAGWVTLRHGNDEVTLHYEYSGNLAHALRAALAQVEAHCEDPLDTIDPTECAGSDADPDGARANARTVRHEEET